MKYIFLIVLFSVISCVKKKDSESLATQVCDCYKQSPEKYIDEKLNSCLQKIASENSKAQISEEQLHDFIKNLIRKCPEYQNDFNQLFLDKFEEPKPKLLRQKDSLLNNLSDTNRKAANLCLLAEISIQENNHKEAASYIDESIKMDPENYYSHWVRSYLFQKDKNFDQAISELEAIDRFSEDSEVKLFGDVMIENLKQEKSKSK